MSTIERAWEERLHRGVLTAADPAEATRQAVSALELELGSSGALYYSFDDTRRLVPHAGRLVQAFSGDLSWYDDDPCRARAQEVLDERLVHATRLLPRRSYVASTAYRQFYGVHLIDHVICLRINKRRHGTPGMCGLFLGRSAEHGDFSDAHKRHLSSILPVLVALHHNQVVQEQLRTILDGLATEITYPQLLLMFSACGELLWSSSGARTLLKQSSAAAARNLLGAAQRGIAMLNESGGRRATSLHPDLGGSAKSWAMELSRLSGDSREPVYVARLVVSRDPEADLAQRYALTPTEAAVLACLGEGMSNAEIASHLEIASSTVATHVKRVLAKMNVRSRLQAGLLMQRARLLADYLVP